MQFVVFEKFIRVLIYPKLHAKNLVNTSKNLTFSSLRVTACHRSLLQPTNDNFDQDNGKNFDRWILKDKTQKLEICLLKTDVFCHFMLSTFHVFPLPPRKEIQLLPRFLCCVLFIWVLVEESVTTGVSSMAFFVVHAGFYSRVREKTKTFLTSLTSFQELHLMWVWVTPFFVSFNEHNYFNFLTVTRTINLRRCMA